MSAKRERTLYCMTLPSTQEENKNRTAEILRRLICYAANKEVHRQENRIRLIKTKLLSADVNIINAEVV